MNWPPAPASGGPRWASGPTDRAHRLRARRTVPAAGGLLGHEVRAAFARRRALGAAQLRAVRRRHALHLPEWPGASRLAGRPQCLAGRAPTGIETHECGTVPILMGTVPHSLNRAGSRRPRGVMGVAGMVIGAAERSGIAGWATGRDARVVLPGGHGGHVVEGLPLDLLA